MSRKNVTKCRTLSLCLYCGILFGASPSEPATSSSITKEAKGR